MLAYWRSGFAVDTSVCIVEHERTSARAKVQLRADRQNSLSLHYRFTIASLSVR